MPLVAAATAAAPVIHKTRMEKGLDTMPPMRLIGQRPPDERTQAGLRVTATG